jgi:AraC-like DNA-binding protein
VRHAQELMRQNPNLPLHAVAEESGFPNETTFLRNFKAQTGVTPSEWKAAL